MSAVETGSGGGPARGAIAGSILAVLLLGGYFAASRGSVGAVPGGYLVSAAVLSVAFWFPAVRLGSARDVVRSWRPLLAWILAWTLVWDLLTSGLLRTRTLAQEWWIVYPSGVLALGALLALHGAVVARVGARQP